MCSTPKMPAVQKASEEQIAAPTYADAAVTKAGANTRNKTASLAGRDIRTSSRGLADAPQNKKKQLLGD